MSSSPSRYALATFGEPTAPELIRPEYEPEPRAEVSRRELWKIVDAAKAFHRRATTGRLDSDHFHRSKETLEAAFEALPGGVWSKA